MADTTAPPITFLALDEYDPAIFDDTTVAALDAQAGQAPDDVEEVWEAGIYLAPPQLPPPPAPLTTFDKITACFPFESVRPVQIKSMQKVADAIDGQLPYTILEVPTGGGKSPIGIAVGKYSEQAKENIPGAHILTSQNNLLNQMMADFSDIGLTELRGKGNYRCEKHRTDCATGTLVNGGQVCDGCPYRAAKQAFVRKPLGVTNYSYYLTEAKYIGEIQPRDFLILDEAHNIEDEILGTAHIDVTAARCQEMDLTLPRFEADEPHKTRRWLTNHFIAKAEARLEGLQAAMNVAVGEAASSDESVKRNAVEQLKKLSKSASSLGSLVGNIKQYLEDEENKDWLAWTGDKGALTIRPLSAARYARPLLFDRSPHVLMMSATLLDFNTCLRSLGLDGDQATMFAAPSDFPTQNRRIVYWPSGSMGYKDIQATLPNIAKRTELLVNKYAESKGIIHTHSYKINEFMEDYFSRSPHRHRIITHTSRQGDRERAIAHHISSEDPTILMSPSMTEGLDLKDDLSRFQVIVKVPYPFLDPYTRARMERDERWYQLKTALTLVQATGRSVRSAEDYAITVILDSAFEWFLIKNQDILPEWWKAAIEFK